MTRILTGSLLTCRRTRTSFDFKEKNILFSVHFSFFISSLFLSA